MSQTITFEGSGPVRAGHELPVERLSAWLQQQVPEVRGPLDIRQFNGGQSNPTYRLDTPGKSYVLRRKPCGPVLKGAHAVEREHRVISALHVAGFPVPPPLALCEDDLKRLRLDRTDILARVKACGPWLQNEMRRDHPSCPPLRFHCSRAPQTARSA